MKINIFQINPEKHTARLIFSCWKEFDRQGHELPPAHLYDKVYSYEAEKETPEGVYIRFNVNCPADYRGRSLSVSDVIEFIWETGERSCFFCDSIGFQLVEFYSFLVGTEKDMNKRFELLKENRTACETFMTGLVQRIFADDNAPHRAGQSFVQAYLDKDMEGVLLALCGWDMESLLKLVFNEEF